MEISINKSKVEEDIEALNKLLEQCYKENQNNYTMSSKGKTCEGMLYCINGFNTLEEGLSTLITITIRFLENTKDGYLDADEKLAGLLEEVVQDSK